jgi:hypothetical protein
MVPVEIGRQHLPLSTIDLKHSKRIREYEKMFSLHPNCNFGPWIDMRASE